MSLLSSVKGWFGEAQGALAKSLFLDSTIYFTLNNVTIPASGGTTQIDHIVVSRYGIFVIEAKNMKGWIFGDAKSSQWTQSLFGKKIRFQNPLHQNYRHTQALSEFLDIAPDRFHSVVMFWGESEFKTPMPPNVLDRGYVAYITSRQAVFFTDLEVEAIVTAIRTGMLPKSWATRTEHIQSLKARHASITTCPKCGSPLVQRIAKSGANKGRPFLGCSSFPSCRHTVDIAGQ